MFYAHEMGANLSGAEVYMLQSEILEKNVNVGEDTGYFQVFVTWTDQSSYQVYE